MVDPRCIRCVSSTLSCSGLNTDTHNSPGFVTKFGHKLAGQMGWVHLYTFSWFFVCTIASVVYYALSMIGDYAKEERSMPFEALAREQEDVLDGVPGSDYDEKDVSAVNVAIDDKV